MQRIDDNRLHSILQTLAVVRNAGRADVCAIAGLTIDDDEWTAIVEHAAIQHDNCAATLDDETSYAILKALETNDALHFRRLHQRALTYLAQAEDPLCYQNVYYDIFVRLAESLLNQPPQELQQLLDNVPHHYRSDPRVRRQCTFYQAIVLRNTEQYTNALQTFNELLAEPTLPTRLRARTLNSRAVCFYHLGQLQRAVEGLDDSKKYWHRVHDPLQEGKVLLNMGIILYELHDYVKAESTLLCSAEIFEQLDSKTWLASTHNELGKLYTAQGRWSRAVVYLNLCLALRRKEDAQDRVGVVLRNLGDVHFLRGELDIATAAYTEALEIMTNNVWKIDTHVALSLLNLCQSNMPEAEEQLEKARKLAKQTNRQDIEPTLAYRAGDLRHRRGDWAGALAQWDAAIEKIEKTRTPLSDEELRISLLGRWQQLYEATILLHFKLGHVVEAFNYVERARARAFLDLVAGDPGQTVAAVAAAQNRPSALTEIQSQLRSDDAVVEFFFTGEPGTHRQLLDSLPQDAHFLLDYLFTERRLLAFVLTPDSIHAAPVDLSSSRLQSLYFNRRDGRLRGVTPTPGRRLSSSRRRRDLGDRLFAPIRPFLEGKRHIIFVAHGLLHYIPLHALRDLDELTGVENSTVSYAPSGSVLAKTLASVDNGGESRPILTVGVDADGLSHAEAEAAAIAQLYGGTSLLGAEATIDAVRKQLADFRVVHISCHGRFRRQDPMASGLQLSDGYFTAADIMQSLRFDADLVTLSACDTGLNQLLPSDELMGLTRAFIGKGVRSLLVTLWPVQELPTRIFMEIFYATWLGGATKAKSVMLAQRHLSTITTDVLRQMLLEYDMDSIAVEPTLTMFHDLLPGPKPFNHPYYWGAFVLIGDPR